MPKRIRESSTPSSKGIGDLQTLDLNNPPLEEFPFQEFPRLVYKHPADKTKEHTYKSVANKQEMDAAVKAGWNLKPHVPVDAEQLVAQ